MSSIKPGVPYWVAQLESPVAPKSKVAGIQDPPGFGSGASLSKVRSVPSFFPMSAVLTCDLEAWEGFESRGTKASDLR